MKMRHSREFLTSALHRSSLEPQMYALVSFSFPKRSSLVTGKYFAKFLSHTVAPSHTPPVKMSSMIGSQVRMCDIDFWRIRLHGRLPHASKPVDNATATDKVTTIVRNMVEKSGKERDLYNCCFYCSATRATTQVLQPKSVNKRYRGRHMLISLYNSRMLQKFLELSSSDVIQVQTESRF